MKSKFLASCMLLPLAVSNIGITQVSSMEHQFNYKSFMKNAKQQINDDIIFDYFLITMSDVYTFFYEEVPDEYLGFSKFINNLRFSMRGGHWKPEIDVVCSILPSMYLSKGSWEKIAPYVRILCANLRNLSMEEITLLRCKFKDACENQCIGTGYQPKDQVDQDFLDENDFEIDNVDPFKGLDITEYSGINAPEESIKNYSGIICSICFQELGYIYNEPCLIHGKHAFHQSCLGEWWKAKVASPTHFQVCPVCKKNCRGSNLIRAKFVANKSSKK